MTTNDIFSAEVPELLKVHLEHLRASGISLEVIKARGYRSVLGKKDTADLGFSKPQQRLGLLIPLHGVDGTIVGHQLRPDHPREQRKPDGSPRKLKYENPRSSSIRIDVPPSCHKKLGDPKVPMFITEGVKKVDALATAGACAIGLTGVWGFKGKNIFGGTTVLADFDLIAWNGRTVYLVFDSDSTTNSQVRLALARLTEHLHRKGGSSPPDIKLVHLPQGKDGAKTGADDYLASGHNLADIVALAQETSKPSRLRLEGFRALYGLEDGRMNFYKSDATGVSPIPLTDFSARITEVITRDNGKDQSKWFTIIGRQEDGTPLPPIEVPASAFESLGWLTENWDVRAVMSAEHTAKSKVRQALLIYSRDAARKEIFTHTGWREVNGIRVFLTNGGAIGSNGAMVELDNDLADYSLPPPADDIASSLDASLGFLDIGSHRVTLPLWAAMYLSPLKEIVDTCFTLFLTGLSGTYKSSLSALALNHFGPNFSYNRLPASWTFTENKLEYLMFLLKDMPLVIDDWAPGQDTNKARELEGKAERIMRNQGNRQGRGRLTKDLSGRTTYIPRGMLVTSGEHLPAGQSHNARIFVVEFHRGDVSKSRLFAALEQKHLYSQAMTHYIMWLARRWEELKRDLPGQERSFYQLAAESSRHPRLPAAVGKLYAGLTLGLQFMVSQKALVKKEAEALAGEGWDIFMRWSAEQAERVERQRPARRFIDGLVALINAGRVSFGSTDDDGPRSANPAQPNIGWRDAKGNYLLNPTVAYATVRQFCAGTDEPLTFKEDAVWRDMKELGMTECTSGRNRYVHRLYSDGQYYYSINLKKEAVNEYVTPEDVPDDGDNKNPAALPLIL